MKIQPLRFTLMEKHVKRETYGWLLEVLAIVGLLWALYPMLFYCSIGETTRMPVHFNAAGEADGWGGRGFLLPIPIIALVFYVGFIAMEKYSKNYNYPVKVTEANAAKLHKLGRGLMRHIKVIIIFILAYISNAMLVLIDRGNSFDVRVMLALIGVMFVVIAIYMVLMVRAK